MKTFALLAALALALPAGGAVAQSATVTLDNGGELTRNRDCIRGNGMAACETSSTATTAGGQSATKNRLRTTDSSGTTTSVNSMGPNGQTAGRTKNISR
ncbi:hypothetical protein [Poseidonocella sp. HB161398]|uniref:hypothetical protein n=1 Tax=Poseidonocella sp. HB161398 TaxID=2320855 RepID=UPI00110902CB|nr:hypothetical protein [Poseidonocella sp. HB161398]